MRCGRTSLTRSRTAGGGAASARGADAVDAAIRAAFRRRRSRSRLVQLRAFYEARHASGLARHRWDCSRCPSSKHGLTSSRAPQPRGGAIGPQVFIWVLIAIAADVPDDASCAARFRYPVFRARCTARYGRAARFSAKPFGRKRRLRCPHCVSSRRFPKMRAENWRAVMFFMLLGFGILLFGKRQLAAASGRTSESLSSGELRDRVFQMAANGGSAVEEPVCDFLGEKQDGQCIRGPRKHRHGNGLLVDAPDAQGSRRHRRARTDTPETQHVALRGRDVRGGDSTSRLESC